MNFWLYLILFLVNFFRRGFRFITDSILSHRNKLASLRLDFCSKVLEVLNQRMFKPLLQVAATCIFQQLNEDTRARICRLFCLIFFGLTK